LDRGEYSNALSTIGHAISMRPDEPEYHYVEGRIHESLNSHRNAIEAYGRALRLRPDHHLAEDGRRRCQELLRQ